MGGMAALSERSRPFRSGTMGGMAARSDRSSPFRGGTMGGMDRGLSSTISEHDTAKHIQITTVFNAGENNVL